MNLQACTFGLLGTVIPKFTYPEMHSYPLDAIGEYELQERKVAYEGTLDSNYTTMTLKRLFLITGKTLTCLYGWIRNYSLLT